MEVLPLGCTDQGDLRGHQYHHQHQQPHFGTSMGDPLDEEIDIEALLNRPRPLGRARRRPLYKAPEFVKRLNAFEECEAGKDVIFECHWKAFPKPEIRWFHDDDDVTHNPRYQPKEADNGVLTLNIAKVTKKDEGAYRCRVENQEGSSSTTGYLTVTGDFSDKPLSSRPRRHAERAVSLPPHLRTITEQKSMEEEEAEICEKMPPSPIQDFIDKATGRAGPNYLTWPLVSRAPPPEDNLQASPELDRKVIDAEAESTGWEFNVPTREELRRRREERAEQDLLQRLDSVEKDEDADEQNASPEAPLVNGFYTSNSSSSEPESPPVVKPSKAPPIGKIAYDHVQDSDTPSSVEKTAVTPACASLEANQAPQRPASLPIASYNLTEMADKLTKSAIADAVGDERCLCASSEPVVEEEIVVSETAAVAAAAPASVDPRERQVLPPSGSMVETNKMALQRPTQVTPVESTHIAVKEVKIQEPILVQVENALPPVREIYVPHFVTDTITPMTDQKTQSQIAAVTLLKSEPQNQENQRSVALAPFPWMFYFAFSCCCAFVGVGTEMSPIWYIVLIFFLSLSSFRFAISSPSPT